MKKTILTVMLVMMALTALAAASAPTVHNNDGSTSNYWVHYYHCTCITRITRRFSIGRCMWRRWCIRSTRITTGTTSSLGGN